MGRTISSSRGFIYMRISFLLLIISVLFISVEAASRYRVGAMDYSGYAGGTFVVFVRFDPAIFTNRTQHNFYAHVFNSGPGSSVEAHCLATVDEEEDYPVTLPDGRTTHINTPRYFTRVRVFQFLILNPGLFKISVKAMKGGLGRQQEPLFRGDTIFNWVNINVESHKNNKCLKVATFSVSASNNTKDASTLPKKKDILNVALGAHLLVVRKKRDIKCEEYTRNEWTVTKVDQESPTSKASIPEQCDNYRRISGMNLSGLVSYFARVPVIYPMDLPTFTIPSFLLPPGGNYRICGTFTNSDGLRILCAQITTAESNVTDFLRVVVTPAEESFTWPQADLCIDASRSYFIYELVEAGYFWNKTIRFAWTCEGDASVCDHIISGQKFDPEFQQQGINLVHTTAPKLCIKEYWIQVPSSIRITLMVSAKYKMKDKIHGFQKTVFRDINFVDNKGVKEGVITNPHVFIRCLLNCWYYIDKDSPMLLGFGCFNCEELIPKRIRVLWSIRASDDTWSPLTEGNTTFYFYIQNFHLNVSNEIVVHLMCTYTKVDGGTLQSNATRRFEVPILDVRFQVKEKRPVRNKIEELQEDLKDIYIYFKETPLQNSFGLYPMLYITEIEVHETEDSCDTNQGWILYKDAQACIRPVSLSLTWTEAYYYCRIIYHNASLLVVDGDRKIKFIQDNFGAWEKVNIKKFLVMRQKAYQMKECFTLNTETGNLENDTCQDRLPFICEYNPAAYSNSSRQQNYSLVLLRSFSMPAAISIAPSPRNTTFTVSVVTSSGFKAATFKYTITSRRVNVKSIWKLYLNFRQKLTSGVTHLWTISSILQTDYGSKRSAWRKDVLKILRDMVDSKHNINYNNVDLILAILKRFLQLGDNSLEKMGLILTSINNVINVHTAVPNDPLGDEALFRLELNVLDTLKQAVIDSVINSVVGADDFKVFLLSDGIMNAIYKVITYYALKVGQRFPAQSRIKLLDKSSVTAVWFQPLMYMEFGIGNLSQESHIHISADKYRNLLNDLAIDTFLNVATYTSKMSPFKIRYGDMLVNLPMLMLSVQQKQPHQYAISSDFKNIYDVRLKLDGQDEDIFKKTEFRFKVRLVQDINSNVVVDDSDCLLLKVKISTYSGSILHFLSNLKLEIASQAHKHLKGALDLFDGSFQELPREHGNLSDLSVNVNTVFLPKTSLKQYSLLDGGYYYILIRIQPDQSVNITGRLDGTVNQEEAITVQCVRLMCVEWDSHLQSWSTRYCYPTIYSLGQPAYVNCLCDTGTIFSGGFSPCSKNLTVYWDDFSLEDIDWLDINSRKLHVAFAILCMWLIVVALLVWTSRRDRLEATMGKTFILPRIFSWYQGEHYLICIVTGYTYGCGTKLTPRLTIIGSSDVSFVYVLFPHQEILKTGSEVWFILSCSEDIGTIQSCVLSLPMSTFKDSWHVSHILFRNLRTQEDRYCICDAWIPDVKTNVNFIVRPVTPVPGKNVRSLIFKLMYFMRMLHVVIGIVFDMPGRSFNKSLHVICCFFTLLICMLFCVWATGSVELELKGDIALVSEEKHYQNLALEVNLSAAASSIVSFCVIVWFEVIEHLPTNNVLHWPLRMEYADGSDRNLNKEDGLRQESIGRMMGRAYNRSLASIDLPNSPRSSSLPSIHTQIRQSRQSVKSLQSAQPEAGVKRSKLSLSIFQQMLVNISLEKSIFQRPKKSKNWKGFVQYCSVSLLILLIVFLSVLLAALGTRINSSGYYLTVSLLTFLIVLIIWHPVFIVIVTFLFVEKYKLGKSDADSRVKGWSAQMYTQVQMLDQNKAEALRNVSYKHTYIPVAKKYIYRKQCAQITKSQQIGAGALVNEDYRETSVKRVSLFIFIIVVVIIINLQSGSVSERYMQTKFMRQLIEVGREEIELRQVIEYNDFWEHLRSKFHLATHWSLSNKNTTTSFKTVSNVRVRQIRAAAYKGNCTDDFSMLPAQHCHFDIEYVDVEKRQFALTWEKVTLRSIRTGPFSYVQGTPFQTIRHHYPGGG
ncbi:polycystic kidney disease protein 1-like 2, partial [Biomphalaria pfeifferi]